MTALRHRLARRLINGGAMIGRFRRYLITGLIGMGLIWALAIAYLVLTPKSYTSGFTLILPGTGAGSMMNLESLGQTSTTSASAFSSPDLSPTENYRKLLLSHRVLKAAADASGIAETAFPTPKIELAEQTKLIIVSLTARSPQLAHDRAEALRGVFLQTLDMLRQDEIETRDTSARNVMGGYQAGLEQARSKMIAHQVKTGLVSLEQYSNLVASVEHAREQLADVDAKLAQASAGVDSLTHLLGTTAESANLAMMLRADPFFQTDIDALAKITTEIATISGTRGDANAHLQDLRAEQKTLEAHLLARSAALTGHRSAGILNVPDLSLRDERARLFERLVGELADRAALQGTRATLAAQIGAAQARVVALAQDASRLDDDKRDVQVAETVFSSALGRLGTSKADFYASYPLVQTLEPPSIPDRPSSPLKLLAVAGALAASFFLTLALVMTWLRTHLLQKILKSGSSSQPSREAGFGTYLAHST
jgi:uncharacterized protein involved in exopolysaccharide biosynthesis